MLQMSSFSCSKWRLLSSCDSWASHCGSFFHLEAQALMSTDFSSYDWGTLVNNLSSCDTLSSVAPRHVGSYRIRDGMQVPSTGRQILRHWTTRMVFLLLLFSHWVMSNSLPSHGLQLARPLYPSPSPRVFPSLCSLH